MRYVNKICKLFLLLVLFSVDLSAQTVTTVNGYPVIDLSGLNPLGAVLSYEDAVLRRTEMNEKTPSTDTHAWVGGNASVSGTNGTWNAKMSIKFQVMRANHTVGTAVWATAYNSCKKYAGEDGKAGEWRLPTQRELEQIWILHPQLIGKGNFTAFNNDRYYSATEQSYNEAWGITFGASYVYGYYKPATCRVRCVRDLP